jgi:peptide/nickel transport system permease protein
MSAEDIQRTRAIYGLDQPIPIGYLNWLGKAARGDFGTSYKSRETVVKAISTRVGPTLLLSLTSLLVVMVIAVPVGVFCSAYNGSWIERGLSVVLYSLYSLPSYVTALLLLYVFYVLLRDTFWQLKPGMVSDDYGELNSVAKVGDIIKHMILPLICFSYGGFAYDARFVKANMEEQIRGDYIRTARAKGAGSLRVYWRHAFRNTLIPFVTLLGLSLPGLVSGAIILEQIFAWPGMGTLYLSSIGNRDYPVIMGIVTLLSLLTLLGNLLADIAYAFVDPRISFH